MLMDCVMVWNTKIPSFICLTSVMFMTLDAISETGKTNDKVSLESEPWNNAEETSSRTGPAEISV